MIAVGDITERALRLIGITKERVTAIAGRDCGCNKRQQAMNETGYVWQGWLIVLFRKVLYYREELRNRWQSIRYSQLGQRLYMARRYLWMAGRVLFYGR